MKVKSVLFILLFSLFYTATFSQKKVSWDELSIVYRKEMFAMKSGDKKTSAVYYKDLFFNKNDHKNTIALKDIEGKRITIKGYFLDLGAESIWFMLSRFPFENCFFCTGVGPETVIELGDFENTKSKFKNDDVVTVTGSVYLIEEDGEYIYILENCSVELSES